MGVERMVGVRVVMMAAVAMAGMVACEHHDEMAYDPRVDGVGTVDASPVDMSILEDQTKLHKSVGAVTPAGSGETPASVPATTAATIPATIPAASAPDAAPGAAPEIVPAVPAPASAPGTPATPG